MIPPLFKIPFPDGILRHTRILRWITISSWYFGSNWESLYFDNLYRDSRLQRFKIIIKPDLSDATLHVINTSEIFSDDSDLIESLETNGIGEGYRICEDALVYFWNNSMTLGTYTGMTSAPFINIVTRWDEQLEVESLCPTSGRFVYCTNNRRIAVVDLF